ncbi:amidohydrolase, partial [bacterium]|nr:amidohydrolase [bacterium]
PVWMGGGPAADSLIRIENGRIISVEPRPLDFLPEGTLYLNKDQVLLPSLHDAHLHLCIGGLMLNWADFDGVRTDLEFSERFSEYLQGRELNPEQWIVGKGLDETKLRITREDIDELCPDCPVFIWSHDLHSAFVNSEALERYTYQFGIEDPAGGRFERDEDNRLNGVLRENAAYAVHKLIPVPAEKEIGSAIERGQEYAFSMGITAASASVRSDYLDGYAGFVGTEKHKIRLNIWKVSDSFNYEQDRFIKKHSERFRLETLKGFVDGALGSRSAVFDKPYEDDPENRGIALVQEGPLARYVRAANVDGMQVALHAIGDRANAICLDAFEMAGCSGRGAEYRPRIEHCQVLRERDIGRFAEFGVIASMQPIHCIADMPFTEKRIGRERCRFSYAWKSLQQAGARLAFGSDWPVENIDPLLGIHAAVTRQHPSGWPQGGWQAQECLTVEAALQAYTSGSAYAARWEQEGGTVAKGKWADFTILSKNILESPAKEILDTKVEMTVVGGEVVYERTRAEGGGMKEKSDIS